MDLLDLRTIPFLHGIGLSVCRRVRLGTGNELARTDSVLACGYDHR